LTRAPANTWNAPDPLISNLKFEIFKSPPRAGFFLALSPEIFQIFERKGFSTTAGWVISW
jgi:hypothetical protein